VDLLVQAKLLERSKSGLKIGKSQIHLGSDSPFITKHHMNWRLKAMQNMGNRKKDFHYSSVATLSEIDTLLIKEILVNSIKDVKSIIRIFKEEKLVCFSVDFFQV
jgi:hypothetical protein